MTWCNKISSNPPSPVFAQRHFWQVPNFMFKGHNFAKKKVYKYFRYREVSPINRLLKVFLHKYLRTLTDLNCFYCCKPFANLHLGPPPIQDPILYSCVFKNLKQLKIVLMISTILHYSQELQQATASQLMAIWSPSSPPPHPQHWSFFKDNKKGMVKVAACLQRLS